MLVAEPAGAHTSEQRNACGEGFADGEGVQLLQRQRLNLGGGGAGAATRRLAGCGWLFRGALAQPAAAGADRR